MLHRDLQRDYQQGATQGGNDPADSDSCLLRSVTDSLYSEYNGYSLVEKLMAVISESFAPQERKKDSNGQYARPGTNSQKFSLQWPCI